MKKNIFFESLSSLGILLVILVLINVVADRFSAKLDITEEKLFSLLLVLKIYCRVLRVS